MKISYVIAEIVPSSMHSTMYNQFKIHKGGYREHKTAVKALRQKAANMPAGTAMTVLQVYYKPVKK